LFEKRSRRAAVVPVVGGKVEIWRMLVRELELGDGLVLENRAVELRGSGEVDQAG
jgi:hypothetical protein